MQGEMLPSPSDYKASLIVLTVQNWLLRLSADSGEVLEKVYLAGSCCKFFRYYTTTRLYIINSHQQYSGEGELYVIKSDQYYRGEGESCLFQYYPMADNRFVSLEHYPEYCSCMILPVEEFHQLKYYGVKFGIKFHKTQHTICFSLTTLQPLVLQWQHTRRELRELINKPD